MKKYQYQITIDRNFSSVREIEAISPDDALRKILIDYSNDAKFEFGYNFSMEIALDREDGVFIGG